MRKWELWMIVGCSAFQTALVLLGITGAIRVASGFLFVALWPGYALLAAIYRPFRQDWDILQRIGLAVPVSLALSVSLGLALDKLGLSVQPETNALWMGCFACGTALIAAIHLQADGANANGETGLRRISVFVGFLIIGLALGLLAGTPGQQSQEQPLSLYVLDTDGQVLGSPIVAAGGVPVRLIVGGAYEGDSEQRLRLVSSAGTEIPLTVRPGEVWQRSVELTFQGSGTARISWDLYLAGTTTPARSVHVWITTD